VKRCYDEKAKLAEGGAAGGGNDQFMSQMLGKLMTNPKTAAYMKDPEFVQKLMAIQKNPAMATQYLQDPKI